jgi:hypothetical protein
MPEIPPLDEPTRLSRGALFMLVTSLALALAYHPATGSLVFGPTTRFWRLSPISTTFEILLIVFRISRVIFNQTMNRWESRSSVGVQTEVMTDGIDGGVGLEETDGVGLGETSGPVLSLRNEAYAMVIARALNGPVGDKRKQLYRQRNEDATEKMVFFRTVTEEINEGVRFRMGVTLPIMAQIVKISVVKGIVFPKVLGYALFLHGLVIEAMVALARIRRSGFLEQEEKDIVFRVNELLGLDKASMNGSGRATWDMYEHRVCQAHMVGLLALLPVLLYLRFFALGAFIAASVRWAIPIPSVAKNAKNQKLMTRIMERYKTGNARMSVFMTSLQWGGRGVGSSTGSVCFVAWVLWCVLCFDPKGTVRPDWPWLDWLG